MYQLADVAFVGGSLVPRGGHNIVEPAQFGKPILIGPHTDNFRDMVEMFRSKDAVMIASAQDFIETLLRLVDDPAMRNKLSEQAQRVLESNYGATGRTVDALAKLLAQPRPARPC